MDYELTDEERDILERFERGELRPAPDAEREMEMARQAARNTLDELEQALSGDDDVTSNPPRSSGVRSVDSPLRSIPADHLGERPRAEVSLQRLGSRCL